MNSHPLFLLDQKPNLLNQATNVFQILNQTPPPRTRQSRFPRFFSCVPSVLGNAEDVDGKAQTDNARHRAHHIDRGLQVVPVGHRRNSTIQARKGPRRSRASLLIGKGHNHQFPAAEGVPEIFPLSSRGKTREQTGTFSAFLTDVAKTQRKRPVCPRVSPAITWATRRSVTGKVPEDEWGIRCRYNSSSLPYNLIDRLCPSWRTYHSSHSRFTWHVREPR